MSFETLVKKISSTLKRITYRLNGHYTIFNHDDLYQEALLHLWDDYRAGKLTDKTDSYILQGCYFHLKNYIRTHKDPRTTISLDVTADEAEECRSFTERHLAQYHYVRPAIDFLHDKLLADTIHNNGFTSREKKILMYYAHGLTVRDIGRMLGISHVMVVKLMGKIKEKCKKYNDFS